MPGTALVVALMRLLRALMKQYGIIGRDNYSRPEELIWRLDILFIFAAVWTLGASIDEPGRRAFHQFFNTLIRDTIKCETKKDKLVKFEKTSLPPDSKTTII